MIKITIKIIASREKFVFTEVFYYPDTYVFYNVKIICFQKKKILSHR